jgi:hypothetical protein
MNQKMHFFPKCLLYFLSLLSLGLILFNLTVFDFIDWLDVLKPATAVRDKGCILKKGIKGGEDLVRWND